MRHADAVELASAVTRVVSTSAISEKFDRISVETDDYSRVIDFLRVVIILKEQKNVADEDIDLLTSSIESEILKIDDRFPSVRFVES